MKSVSYMMRFKIGAPPSIGWWPTQTKYVSVWNLRWWNGVEWSLPVSRYETRKKEINKCARMSTGVDSREIFWAPRPSDWPARSKT